MKRFHVIQPLYMKDDEQVAEGVMFTDGQVVITDLCFSCVTIYKSIEDFPETMFDFKVEIEWIDE